MSGLELTREHEETGIKWKGNSDGYVGESEHFVFDIEPSAGGYTRGWDLYAYPKNQGVIRVTDGYWIPMATAKRVVTLMAWAEWYEVTHAPVR